ncbi:unnamed protein product [Strongylus vulgaris]|uniref:Uncharacterized protein n=1 Tax=Strongylus vulgaris TaxID=40348 RepID=A0A3P7JX45_STRVU|nr:unnamed protein product [Strongylus vulgaris]
MAFDWNGRNLYVGNKISQTIEVVRTVGTQYRAVVLSNDQTPTAVVTPVSIAVDSDRGLLFWLDRLFYSDSAFDSIDVATIVGDGQPPQFSHFKKDVENLVNIKVLQPRACELPTQC